MRVVKTDAKSYLSKTLEKYLQEAERAKKKMYLEACLQQRRQLSPFVDSVYGLLDMEARSSLKRISRRLATKWRQPYSRTCGYVKNRIATTLVWSTHCCIRISRVPEHRISVQRLHWEDGTNINQLG